MTDISNLNAQLFNLVWLGGNGDKSDRIKELVAAGADVNEGAQYRAYTPLLTAISMQDVVSAKLLLVLGADPNAAHHNRAEPFAILTPLIAAVNMLKNPSAAADMVDTLLAHGADPHQRDANTKTARCYASDQAGGHLTAIFDIYAQKEVESRRSALAKLPRIKNKYISTP